ncbi:MAG TPA: MFS transporter [Acetobacteraceae bacterium]|nr:MFS transporter [Acetobacteraceae bacterium]
MQASSSINVTELIDRHPIGGLQKRVILLCGLVALLDGFDVLAIGLAAPAMGAALHIAPGRFGVVFSAALLGLMLGAFALGPLADRFGRKSLLIGSTLLFGVFTLCTAGSSSLQQVLLFRFLAGLGLGGAMPGFISLAAEFTPRARRGTVVGLLFTGFPLGGVIVGLAGTRLIGAFGWPSLFYIGGVLPLALVPVLLLALPDSIGFLVTRAAAQQKIRDLIVRIAPALHIPPAARFMVDDPKLPGIGVGHLFTQGRARGTALIWACYFVTFLMLLTIGTWTPTLLRGAGIGATGAALAVAVFAVGSVFGTPLGGFLVGRFTAPLVLPVLLVGSALALGALGCVIPSVPWMIALQVLVGFFLGAASSGLIALAASFYPLTIRSTGVGWSMGLGRLGSFVGPLAIGALVAAGWLAGSIFAALGAPALLAALGIALLRSEPARA